MMKTIIKIFLVFICIISFVNLMYNVMNYKNIYKEKNKRITGIITNIRKKDDTTIFDIKNKHKYRCTLYKEKFNYQLGDKIDVSGLVYTASDNTVFNLFNYRKYLLSKKINYLIKVDNVSLKSKNNNILYMAKNKMIKHISKYKSKDYLAAFLLGDTSLISEKNKENYQAIGISHLLAVSGMHVGIFVLILNFIFKKTKYKDIIIFIFLAFFLFLTNFTESLMRCTLFMFLNFLNKRYGFNIKLSNVLILTFFLLIVYNPYLIYSTGFLFSIIITYFIIIGNKLLKNKKGYFKSVFYVSIISFLSSIPIISISFFKINFLSIFYNLIFVPLVSLIIFPLSIITFIIPFLDNILLFLINVFNFLVSLASDIKIFTFVLAKPNIFIIFIYYIILHLAISKNIKFIIVIFIMLIINMNVKYFISKPEVIFLDVGQGDCNIIILPHGKTILIDTGGKIGSDFSVAKKSIIPYLNSRGINKIECLILTHGDYDHMGDAISLINNIKVEKVFINKGDINYNEELLIKKYKNVKKIKSNYKIDNYEFLFLNHNDYNDENKNSIVTYLQINNKGLIFMGDADKESEKNIIKEYNLPKMYILKVGHHGSKTSSDKSFIDLISPYYSVISVGLNNKFGHPNKETINTLKNSKVLHTSKLGSIRFVFNKYMVNKFDCKPYIIIER